MTGGGVLLYLALNYTTAINVSLIALPSRTNRVVCTSHRR